MKNQNLEKIYSIINKYKNVQFQYFEEFYRKIIFQNYHQDYIELATIPDIKQKYINLDKDINKLNLKNYEVNLVGNMGGLNFSIVKKSLFKTDNHKLESYDFLRKYILSNGGKYYINTKFYKIKELSKKEIKSFYNIDCNLQEVKFNNDTYQLRHLPYSLDKKEKVDLVILDTKQKILTSNFIYDLFYAIDEVSFIDTLALKYFTDDERNDRINIYISNKIKNYPKLSKKLFDIIYTLIVKYQNCGLKFEKNSFILPYEYDENRFVANCYIPDSFNKSILLFILMYKDKSTKFCHEFYYCNNISKDISDYRNVDKLENYIKNCKEDITFKKFVFDIFDLYKDKNISEYIKTYEKLFQY